MKKILFIMLLFFVWRLFLFIPLLVGERVLPHEKNSKQYTLWAYAKPYAPVKSVLLYPWANFDGVHYLTIAGDASYQHGSDGRFFPFYPFVSHFAAQLVGGGAVFGAVNFFSTFLIGNLTFLLALIVLYKLILLDYSEKTAMTSILLLLLFPASFFFGAIYSESMFLLLTVSVFYFLRKKKYFFVSLLSLALVVTRIVGVCIVPIVIYEMFSNDIMHLLRKEKKFLVQPFLQKFIFLLLIPLGLFAFLLYSQYAWGDWLFFIHAQEHVVNGRSNHIIFFPQTIVRYGKILLTVSPKTFDFWISLLEIGSFFFAAVLLLVGFLKKINRSYLFFAVLAFLISTGSGTFSGLPRYVSVLFPLFLSFALLKNRWLMIVYGVFSLTILFLLVMFFSRGYFVA